MLRGCQAHSTQASPALPGHKASAAPVNEGEGGTRYSGRRMAVLVPHVALGTLTLPLSETFLQDMAPGFQASRHPSRLPQHTCRNWRGSRHVPGAVPSPVYLTSARLEQQLVTAPCGLGPVRESPRARLTVAPRQVL